MATITVEITERGISYPDGQKVHRGDTVNFHTDGSIGDVTVTFNPPYCFTSSDSLTLNAASSLTATQPETVSSSADPGKYTFTADIPEASRKKFPEWEAKQGEVDVSPDY